MVRVHKGENWDKGVSHGVEVSEKQTQLNVEEREGGWRLFYLDIER